MFNHIFLELINLKGIYFLSIKKKNNVEKIYTTQILPEFSFESFFYHTDVVQNGLHFFPFIIVFLYNLKKNICDYLSPFYLEPKKYREKKFSTSLMLIIKRPRRTSEYFHSFCNTAFYSCNIVIKTIIYS